MADETPAVAYIVTVNDLPRSVAFDLATAQAEAETHAKRYALAGQEPDFRWDERPHHQTWRLMHRDPRTRRFGWTLDGVHVVPVLAQTPAADAEGVSGV